MALTRRPATLGVPEHAPRHDRLPPSAGGLARRRRIAGWVICFAGLPLLTAVLVATGRRVEPSAVLLLYLLAVVVVAVVGGLYAGLSAAVLSCVLANWFLTPPYYTLRIASGGRAWELAVFLCVAALVSAAVEIGARDRVRAERSLVEASLLADLTSSDIGAASPERVLDQLRELFELDYVALTDPAAEADGRVLVTSGTPASPATAPTLRVETDSSLLLVGEGEPRFGQDNRLLRTLAETAARAWRERVVADEAARAAQLSETDKVRAALLAAVSHDLRTPLAGIKAAVSSLRQDDVTWTPEESTELLASIEDSTDRLTLLIGNLLAMSRIQAGAVSVDLAPVSLGEIVGRVASTVPSPALRVDVGDDLPLVWADEVLLERVLTNVLENAARFSDAVDPVLVRGRALTEDRVELAVIDHGPGVAPADRERMFAPYQRLGDRDAATGVGLGLAIARGFSDAMQTTLTPSETPRGGLTMTLGLRAAWPAS